MIGKYCTSNWLFTVHNMNGAFNQSEIGLEKETFVCFFSLFFLTQFIFRLTGNFRDELKTTFIYVR